MRRLLKPDYRNTSYYAHAHKDVLDSVLLDDMRDLSKWSVRPHLSINNDPADERGIDTGTLSKADRDGIPCARLTSATDCTEKNVDYGRGWGLATLFRDCESADWSGYNRLRFQVFPDFPGFKVATMCIYLYTDGPDETRMPNDVTREGLHFVCLENQKWNTVTWEFPELVRDKVKGFSFQYRLQGAEPGAGNQVSLDFAEVRLEKVDADHQRGWEPKEGEICFSHVGYLPKVKKTAIGKGLRAEAFEVIRSGDGLAVFRGKVEKKKEQTGEYQLLDFSGLQEPGRYFIKAGEKITRPFSIGKDVWRDTIVKALNFFYGERCGYLVPGVHDVCHGDLQCSHNGVTKVINGGWHDAGDLSQGLGNTAEATYAMLCLMEKAKAQGDRELYELLLDEARWGADWVLKTRFGDGYRASWICMDFWTKGLLGDYDDIIHQAARHVQGNLLCAGVEAKMAIALREEDPVFAGYALTAAKEDFAWAMEDMEKGEGRNLVYAAQGCISAVLLYQATGDQAYRKAGEDFALYVTQCQQAEEPDWEIPLYGFFYEDAGHKRIVHSQHSSREHLPMTALAMINGISPRAEYLSCMERYGAYIKKAAAFTEPYAMVPASIYRLEEVVEGDSSTWFSCPTAEVAKEQIQNGIRLSEGVYLRLFPVWYSFRGNSGIQLSQAKGILACANALRDKELFEIVTRALEWQVGRNPFNQSLVWGEGYHYTPQYSAMSGDLVGSFSVGVESQRNEDIPYYPDAACYNYKEVWVFPAMGFLNIMAEYDTEE